MAQLVLTHPPLADETADAHRTARLLDPRDDVVAEREVAPGRFGLADGPFTRWERSVVRRDDGSVLETVSYRLAIPLWSIVFAPLLRRWLRHGAREQAPAQTPAVDAPARRSMPWWAPPQRLDARASTTLGLLASVALVAGYLGTLLTQTNTYAKSDFGSTDGEVGTMLATVRVGALLALVIVAMADRRGRSRILTITSVGACVLTATGALAPGLFWLGASQTLARALSTAMALLVSVMVIEETPAGARAYAISLLTMSAGLGAGMCVMLLFIGDLGEGGWRVLFLVPLLAVLPLARLWRSLPETRRFQATAIDPGAPTHPGTPTDPGTTRGRDRGSGRRGSGRGPSGRRRPARWTRSHLGRLVLLSASGLCLALFVSPAAGFQNEYLRSEHGYVGWQITLFTICTNTPAGLGILVGGKLADIHGRRRIGAIGVAAGSVLTVAMYLGSGWTIWAWSLGGAVLGAIAVPALAVYGPELFPTTSRGRANGIINLFSVAGSAAGLLVVGHLADTLSGGLPTAVAWMALGPLLVVGLILVLYPETASLELEEINPEDAPLTRGMLELDGLDL